jgi:hypothetical protein
MVLMSAGGTVAQLFVESFKKNTSGNDHQTIDLCGAPDGSGPIEVTYCASRTTLQSNREEES